MDKKAAFRDRISLARVAWAKCREQIPDQPQQPPTIFEAGFTLGMVTQKQEKEET